MRAIALLLLLSAAACGGCSRESGVGFRLPDGDAERGRAAYVELRCHSCHHIEGVPIPHAGEGLADVALGGPTARVKTYGELVTAIINPSHKLSPRYREEQVAANGESLMSYAFLNDVMTVQQLIDLVAFLQGTYEVLPPPAEPYWYVYP
jgi:hypothetical protein